MNSIFQNTVLLRGFLGKNAEVPSSEGITDDACAFLTLGTVSGTWDIATNEWTPRTDWHRVICPGPWFCGFTRGMRRGDYVEVEAEFREQEHIRQVVVEGQHFPVKHSTYAIYAVHVRKLDRPLFVVDSGDSD